MTKGQKVRYVLDNVPYVVLDWGYSWRADFHDHTLVQFTFQGDFNSSVLGVLMEQDFKTSTTESGFVLASTTLSIEDEATEVLVVMT